LGAWANGLSLFFLVLIMPIEVGRRRGLTLGSGGNGGNFGPSLFMGAYPGVFPFARFLQI